MSDSKIFNERIERLRAAVASSGLDGILFLDLFNIRYLTGFSGSEGALFIDTHNLALFVDGRYTTQAAGEAPQAAIVAVTDKMEGIAGYLSARGAAHIGFESAAITFDGYRELRDRLTSGELIPFSGELRELRAVKDGTEIAKMKTAAAIAARSLTKTLAAIRQGMREREIAALLESTMLGEGGEKPSFDTIVASGKNAALPHAHPGSRPLQEGDFIVVDYGSVYEGYHSDETCTVALGAVSAEQKRIYEIVKGAHDRALDAVKPGVRCRDIDAAARSHIEDAGYGACFTHGTGHGVGLAVHEAPVVSSRSQAVLKEGMVITVEPGIYIPGSWGIRIEDMALVTADGCDILTEMPKHLIVL